MGTRCLVVFDDNESLEPVDSMFASSAEKFSKYIPEGRLDAVDVREKKTRGLKTVGESAWNKGADVDGLRVLCAW